MRLQVVVERCQTRLPVIEVFRHPLRDRPREEALEHLNVIDQQGELGAGARLRQPHGPREEVHHLAVERQQLLAKAARVFLDELLELRLHGVLQLTELVVPEIAGDLASPFLVGGVVDADPRLALRTDPGPERDHGRVELLQLLAEDGVPARGSLAARGKPADETRACEGGAGRDDGRRPFVVVRHGGHHLLHRAAASPRRDPLSPTIATSTSPGELVAAPASMWLIDLEGNDAVPARWLGANPPGVPTEGRSPFLATRHVRSPHGESPHSSPGKAHAKPTRGVARHRPGPTGVTPDTRGVRAGYPVIMVAQPARSRRRAVPDRIA